VYAATRSEEEKASEVGVIEVTDAIIDPRTMMIHLHYTPSTTYTQYVRTSDQLMSTHVRTVPLTQSRLGDRSVGVAGPRLWNSLPVELRQQDICLAEFRRLLKS